MGTNSCNGAGTGSMSRFNRTSSRSTLRILGGSSHPELTALIAKKVGVKPGKVVLDKFSNNETTVRLGEPVRNQDIFIIQTGTSSSSSPSSYSSSSSSSLKRYGRRGELKRCHRRAPS